MDDNFARSIELINFWLSVAEPPDGLFKGLKVASASALCQGGKRFRPLLCTVVGETLGVNAESLRPYAVALEMIHAASLVHDDLPGLDNSDERRGRPAVHKKFGEAAAILTGDLLISEAFRVISEASEVPAEVRCSWIAELTSANALICSGQLREIAEKGENSEVVISEKTAALIRAAVMGAPIFLESSLEPNKWEFWSDFGLKLGMLFQLRDDQLDDEAGEQHQTRGDDIFAEITAMLDRNYPTVGQLKELVGFVWGRGS